MAIQEVSVPLTKEDFSIDDEVFRLNYTKKAEFGQVYDVDDDIIDILMEDGRREWIPIEKFISLNSEPGWRLQIAKKALWGKMMNVNDLFVGSDISRFDLFDKSRIAGKVTELVFPTEAEAGRITLKWPERNQEIPYTVKDMYELKRLMLLYDLEG